MENLYTVLRLHTYTFSSIILKIILKFCYNCTLTSKQCNRFFTTSSNHPKTTALPPIRCHYRSSSSSSISTTQLVPDTSSSSLSVVFDRKENPRYSINPSEFLFGFRRSHKIHSNGGDGFKLYPNGSFPNRRVVF